MADHRGEGRAKDTGYIGKHRPEEVKAAKAAKAAVTKAKPEK